VLHLTAIPLRLITAGNVIVSRHTYLGKMNVYKAQLFSQPKKTLGIFLWPDSYRVMADFMRAAYYFPE